MNLSTDAEIRPRSSAFLSLAKPVLVAHQQVFQNLMQFSWTALHPQWIAGETSLDEVTFIEQLTLRPPAQASATCAFSFSWEILTYLAEHLWGEKLSYDVEQVEALAKDIGQIAMAQAFAENLPPLLTVRARLGLPQKIDFKEGAVLLPCLTPQGPLKIFWAYQEFKQAMTLDQ